MSFGTLGRIPDHDGATPVSRGQAFSVRANGDDSRGNRVTLDGSGLLATP
jgi:hypothetical protein